MLHRILKPNRLENLEKMLQGLVMLLIYRSPPWSLRSSSKFPGSMKQMEVYILESWRADQSAKDMENLR